MRGNTAILIAGMVVFGAILTLVILVVVLLGGDDSEIINKLPDRVEYRQFPWQDKPMKMYTPFGLILPVLIFIGAIALLLNASIRDAYKTYKKNFNWRETAETTFWVCLLGVLPLYLIISNWAWFVWAFTPQ